MGAVTTPQPRVEDDTTTPQFDYGKSKQLAEESVRELAEKEGVDFTILRPSGIFNDSENEFQLVWAANLGLFFFTPFNKRHGTATFLRTYTREFHGGRL
jgi:nucleoside-diphosphate-sugar epimerase